MLHEKWNIHGLKDVIMPVEDFRPFPRYGDRDAWNDIVPKTAKAWIEAAEAYLDYEWPAMTADMYMILGKTGSLKPHWDRFRERRSGLGMLALAECIEGNGRFLDQIINGIISTCEETTWIQALLVKSKGFNIPDAEAHEVDLASSETASLLAWISYLLSEPLDKINPRIRKRIRETIYDRIVRPYLDRDDYWWMGFTNSRINNWNPWCNMNVIMCLLLIDYEEKTRISALYKVLRSLDRYMETYSPDGCCDEGPMYWEAAGAGLFICLSLLHEASGGKIDIFNDEKLRDIGGYITKAYIDGNYFVNYADGDAKVKIDSTTYRFGKAIGNEAMISLGASAPVVYPFVYDWFRAYQYLQEIFNEKERASCDVRNVYLRDAWLWKTGVMTARVRENSAEGLFVSAKAGSNIESHNHNDVGNFIVYADGKPLLIDVGTEEYSVKTFSPQRYDIWYIQSQYHNCPGVGAVLQHDGHEYHAEDVKCELDTEKAELRMEISKAYPDEAGINSWHRTVCLWRGEDARITVTDKFDLAEPTDEIYRYLMTPCKPVLEESGIRLAYDQAAWASSAGDFPARSAEEKTAFIHIDTEQTAVTVEEIPMTESRLRSNWGDMLYRIVLHEKNAVKYGEMKMTIRV